MKLVNILLPILLLVAPALATENPSVQLAARSEAEKAQCIAQCNVTKDHCISQCQGSASCLERCTKVAAMCHVKCSY